MGLPPGAWGHIFASVFAVLVTKGKEVIGMITAADLL